MTVGVYITGMARSGTTLVDKLFANFTNFNSFSQPLPLLLVQLKKDYLRRLDVPASQLVYPISDQQFNNTMDVLDFTNYLNDKLLTKSYLEKILSSMIGYSGQWFKSEHPLSSLEHWESGSVFDFIQHYFTTHRIAQEGQQNNFAWKEALAEVFIPYFHKQGVKVILIIRDPRDVLSSMYPAKSEIVRGIPRPLLWVIRQWRKSVAYLFEYSDSENIRILFYENLVQFPDKNIKELCDWLGITPNNKPTNIINTDGGEWRGNSSFSEFNGISAESVGRYINSLSVKNIRFVEALCFSEMRALGYELSVSECEIEDIMKSGPEDDFFDRQNLSHYFYNNIRRDEELTRWRILKSTEAKFDSSLFIFEKNFQNLRQ